MSDLSGIQSIATPQIMPPQTETAGTSANSGAVVSAATPDTVAATGTMDGSATGTGDRVSLSEAAKALLGGTQPSAQLIATANDMPQGTASLLATATTQSGRQVRVEQYTAGADPARGTAASSAIVVTIGATDRQAEQRYLVTDDTIINEDAHGDLAVAAYTPGQETDGNDVIIGVRGLAYQGGDGNDTIVTSSGNVDIDAGSGNDTVVVAGVALAGNISLGDGNDSLSAMCIGTDGRQVNITTGAGNDTISASYIGMGGQVNIDTGDGNDAISASYIGLSGQVNIDTGEGDDTIDASWIGLGIGMHSQVNIATGAGNDAVTSSWTGVSMGSGATQVNIDTGDGNDLVGSSWFSASFFGGHSQTNIATGAGNDTIAAGALTASFFGGTSQTNIDTGTGDDTITASLLGVHIGHTGKLELLRTVVEAGTSDTGQAASDAAQTSGTSATATDDTATDTGCTVFRLARSRYGQSDQDSADTTADTPGKRLVLRRRIL